MYCVPRFCFIRELLPSILATNASAPAFGTCYVLVEAQTLQVREFCGLILSAARPSVTSDPYPASRRELSSTPSSRAGRRALHVPLSPRGVSAWSRRLRVRPAGAVCRPARCLCACLPCAGGRRRGWPPCSALVRAPVSRRGMVISRCSDPSRSAVRV